MKKFICFLLCAVLIVCGTLALVGCDKPDNSNGFIDLSKLSEGDEIPIYPNCEFDYKYVDKQTKNEYVFHIKNITAKFVKANKIEEGNIIEGTYYPYEIELSATGNTDKSLANYSFYLNVRTEQSYQLNVLCTVDNDGNFISSKNNLYASYYISNAVFMTIHSLEKPKI